MLMLMLMLLLMPMLILLLFLLLMLILMLMLMLMLMRALTRMLMLMLVLMLGPILELILMLNVCTCPSASSTPSTPHTRTPRPQAPSTTWARLYADPRPNPTAAAPWVEADAAARANIMAGAAPASACVFLPLAGPHQCTLLGASTRRKSRDSTTPAPAQPHLPFVHTRAGRP